MAQVTHKNSAHLLDLQEQREKTTAISYAGTFDDYFFYFGVPTLLTA
jgi:hypothetical protein